MMLDLESFGLSDDFDRAGQAIETMVAARHPANDQHRWGAIKPMSVVGGWGQDLSTWTLHLGMILTNFNTLIRPRRVTFTQIEVRNSGGLPLRNLQLYLAQQAQHAHR
ncbi:hypothetical protein [Caulobacter sp. LARHSG274]